MTFNLTSPAFTNGSMIPSKYTADGVDIAPPLSWSTPAEGTKSLVLICDDPDAPIGLWVHWIVYCIPPDCTSLQEGASKHGLLPQGCSEGTNSWGNAKYGGPAPPSGTHRYFFKLYALDVKMKGGSHPNSTALLHAIKPHIIGTAELIGKYHRQ